MAEIVALGYPTDTLADVSEMQLREKLIRPVRLHRPYALVTFDPSAMYGEMGIHAIDAARFLLGDQLPGYEHCSLPMYQAWMAGFERCCSTGSTPVASAEVGLTALRIIEAANSCSANHVR